MHPQTNILPWANISELNSKIDMYESVYNFVTNYQEQRSLSLQTIWLKFVLANKQGNDLKEKLKVFDVVQALFGK